MHNIMHEAFYCPYCKAKLKLPTWRIHLINNECGQVPIPMVETFTSPHRTINY